MAINVVCVLAQKHFKESIMRAPLVQCCDVFVTFEFQDAPLCSSTDDTCVLAQKLFKESIMRAPPVMCRVWCKSH